MDDKEFYLDAIRDVVPEHKEEQIQDVFYSFLELEQRFSAPENQGLYQASKAKRIPEFSHDFGCSGVYVKRKRNCTG